MSNKSEATWHPNGGPEVPHADLIARLRYEASEDRRISALAKQQHTKRQLDQRAAVSEDAADALAALGDTVPREKRDAVAWDQGYQAGFERGVLVQAKQASGEAPGNPYRAAAIREEAK